MYKKLCEDIWSVDDTQREIYEMRAKSILDIETISLKTGLTVEEIKSL